MDSQIKVEHALNVSHGDHYDRKDRGIGCSGYGRGQGRQNLDKSTVECFKCHKLGHF